MDSNHLRITSQLLERARYRIERSTDHTAYVRVERFVRADGSNELIAREVVALGQCAAEATFAVTCAPNPRLEAALRLEPALRAGRGGMLILSQVPQVQAGVGFVCRGDGVNWLDRLELVGAEGLRRLELNREPQRPSDPTELALWQLTSIGVVGNGATAERVAACLARRGAHLALRVPPCLDSAFPPELVDCDLVFSCIGANEGAAAPGYRNALRRLCAQRLRVLIELQPCPGEGSVQIRLLVPGEQLATNDNVALAIAAVALAPVSPKSTHPCSEDAGLCAVAAELATSVGFDHSCGCRPETHLIISRAAHERLTPIDFALGGDLVAAYRPAAANVHA